VSFKRKGEGFSAKELPTKRDLVERKEKKNPGEPEECREYTIERVTRLTRIKRRRETKGPRHRVLDGGRVPQRDNYFHGIQTRKKKGFQVGGSGMWRNRRPAAEEDLPQSKLDTPL